MLERFAWSMSVPILPLTQITEYLSAEDRLSYFWVLNPHAYNVCALI